MQNSKLSKLGFTHLNGLTGHSLCSVQMNPQAFTCQDCQSGDDTFESTEKLSDLIADLPDKVYQNCQRTARVVLLSQLQKLAFKQKKLKNELSKILFQFIPNKSQPQSSGQYTTKKGYYESLHYSRVRIGQRQFIKSILLNPLFKDKFICIFKDRKFENCEKARKNQRSQISFEKRTKIINIILKDHQQNFQKFFQLTKKRNEKIAVDSQKASKREQPINKFSLKLPETYLKIQEEDHYWENVLSQNFFVHYLMVPIMPVPLQPNHYENYQRNKNFME